MLFFEIAMLVHTALIFTATVLPIVFAPGPDILFISSQGLAGGSKAAMKANLGVLLGYTAHSILAALGVAAVVMASPVLFNALRWFGVAYVAYLALRMILSAMKRSAVAVPAVASKTLITKGFFTSFLNPKGLLVYFAILPNFIKGHEDVALQSIILSGIYIACCAIVYSAVALIFAQMGKGEYNDKRRRMGEGFAGGLLATAALSLAVS